MRSSPIGVFDSGIGGLSVVAQLQRLLPEEDLIYFGDTARVPYGTKSAKSIISFSREIARFLVKQQVKMVVIACNSASSVALETLQEELSVPVVGVIEPGARGAMAKTGNRKIGILGTTATIHSRAYPTLLESLDESIQPFSQACPLFVPLVEEGMIDHPITRITAEMYLQEVKAAGVDTAILGCTHYPLLKALIQSVMGPEVVLVDSAEETAIQVANDLKTLDLLNPSLSKGREKYYLSDQSPNFQRVGSMFLPHSMQHVQVVNPESI